MTELGLFGRFADPDRALDMYERAAGWGDVEAQNKMGFAYLNGEFRRKNKIIARSWFQKSAAQGDKTGQFNLGILLLQEDPRDPIPAYMWLTLSAQQLDSAAIEALASVKLDASQQAELKMRAQAWQSSPFSTKLIPVHR